MGIRTPDLLHAMQALYQLSYSPIRRAALPAATPRQCTRKQLVHAAGIPIADRVRKDADIVL
jgi:hypothetical protein